MPSEVSDLISKAEVLVEALPYIRTFAGKFFVIKYGGQAMVNDELKKSVVIDIVLLKFIGIKPVLVHGGGKDISELMQKLGKQPHFVNGLRVTDHETMEIAEMVLVGKVNQEIVSLINCYGGKAVGLSGKDAGLLQARRKAPQRPLGTAPREKIDLGQVGDISKIDPQLLHTLCDQGYIPVISPIAVGPSGESLNINADHAAGELAIALQAEKLILLTDVEGIYREEGDEPPVFLSRIQEGQAREMIAKGQINSGMIPKVESCLKALDHHVSRTHIVDGRISHSLLLEVFTDKGIGTMVTK